MPEMKTLNGYEVVDAKARKDIETLKNAGYATETYVDTAIDNIPEVDLSQHALKSELPTKVSQLQNDSKFITRDEVPEQDLSEYITENELLAKGYLTEHQDLSEYAKKSDIPDISDFISEIPSEYITESELDAKGYATGGYVDATVVYLDVSSTTTSNTEATPEQTALMNELAAGKTRTVYFKTGDTDEYTPVSVIVRSANNIEFKTPMVIDSASSKATYYHYYFGTSSGGWLTYKTLTNVNLPAPDLSEYAKKSDIPDVSAYQTEAQVQALINSALGVIENGSY